MKKNTTLKNTTSIMSTTRNHKNMTGISEKPARGHARTRSSPPRVSSPVPGKSPPRVQEHGMHVGSRGSDFTSLIAGILRMGKVSKTHTKILTSEASMKTIGQAFTSDTVSQTSYQQLEQLGDLAANMSIVQYLYSRYPVLHDFSEGVAVAARGRILYGSKQSFYDIGLGMGLLPYITSSVDHRNKCEKDLVEDVFEALFGAFSTILDDTITPGVGYGVVYQILSAIFDTMEMSLAYEDLYDAKTRLKELFDCKPQTFGALQYEDHKDVDGSTVAVAYRVTDPVFFKRRNGTMDRSRLIGGTRIHIGSGKAVSKAEAQQQAAKVALASLKKEGHFKRPPAFYRRFSKNPSAHPEEPEVTTNSIMEKWPEGLNTLAEVRTINRNVSYRTTAIGYYCRMRDVKGVDACLELKADPNIPDCNGFYPIDRLFIGPVDSAVKKIYKKIYRYHMMRGKILAARGGLVEHPNILVSRMVRDEYVVKYTLGNVKGPVLAEDDLSDTSEDDDE